MCNLSILIVTYNPGDLVRDCLRSLPAGAGERSMEVIVIDNASGDGTAARIASEFPHVRLIANADNRGFAAANNQGLQVARGRYLLLLNPDVVVHPGALAEMAAYLDANPTVGIVGPLTDDGRGNIARTARPPYTVSRVLRQRMGLSRLLPDAAYPAEEVGRSVDVAWVVGACLMFRRAVYEQIGGLDEDFFLFGEEADFCDRARQVGWRVTFLPTAAVTHYESSSVARYPYIKVRNYHLSPLWYFRKRRRWGAVLFLKLGFSAALLAKTIIRLIQLIWNRDESVRQHIRAYGSTMIDVLRY